MMDRAEGVIEFLLSLSGHGIKPGLERISALLRELKDPQLAFPSIHIAGTNGKGSTSAMLSSVLTEAGFSTGLYTSPHLARFNERIRISGRLITDMEVVESALDVRRAAKRIKAGDITFFEFTTAMMFLHFSRRKIDIAVVETGMGGRFDATNVITPLVSVITNIGLDHMEYLGDDLATIAAEKAGIIKAGRPVVTGEEKRAPLSVIRRAAKESGSRLFEYNKDFCVSGAENFDYRGRALELKGVRLNLLGPHQRKNAACALAAIEALKETGLDVSKAAMRKGLKKAIWPGRFEIIGRNPYVVLDGAHNPDGALALRKALDTLRYGRLILVLGVMADKDMDSMLDILAPLASGIIVTRPNTERAASVNALMEKLAACGVANTAAAGPVKEACGTALERAGRGDCVCVTGSLYTVGEARDYLIRRLRKKAV